MKRLLAVIAVVIFSSSAHATNYKNEIDKFVVEPCFQANFKRSGAGKLSESAIVRESLQMHGPALMRMQILPIVLPLVEGKSLSERKSIYDRFSRICEEDSKDTTSGDRK